MSVAMSEEHMLKRFLRARVGWSVGYQNPHSIFDNFLHNWKLNHNNSVHSKRNARKLIKKTALDVALETKTY